MNYVTEYKKRSGLSQFYHLLLPRFGSVRARDDELFVVATVFGYTIANDVTARDLQRSDGQWSRAKGFDTFCPVGPWIETEFDPTDALITCHVNNTLRQMSSTREMIFSTTQLMMFSSSIMTLEPGDLILTGTPAGVGILQPGDQVSVHIDGIGTLVNPVAAQG